MTLVLLALHLLLVGVLLPRRLAGSRRLQARPRLGAAVWLALMASFGTGLLLAAHHLLAPLGHEPAGLVGLLPHVERPTAVVPHAHGWWVPAAAVATAAAVAAALAARAARARRRHRTALD
ncbi:M56 family peptidase, partial [Kitasatospora sp. NPDC057692]